MAKVIACVGSKGGVGKTATVFNTAIRLNQVGFSCCVVDCDQQQTLIRLIATRKTLAENKPVIPVFSTHKPTERTLRDVIGEIEAAYPSTDFVLVDVGGYVGQNMVRALLVADLVLLVTKPTMSCYWGLMDTVELVRKLEKETTLGEWRVLYNQVDRRSREALSARVDEAVKGAGLKTMKTVVHDWAWINYAEELGLGATEHYTGQGHDIEYRALVDEILEVLK